MSNKAIFIDLPNFYSRLLKSGLEDSRFLKDYFLDWLDFDILAGCLTDDYSGIWIFYSGNKIGPSSERIVGKELYDYIHRINSLKGVTARDVNIPGEQREPIKFKCENCGNEGISEVLSEKGIDSSLAVHLFDTIDSWDTAYLLAGDADYVPVVASLRRRGKIVIGVGFSDASEALVRECYQYVNLEEFFLNQDILVYKLFKKNGIGQKWLCNEIIPDPSYVEQPNSELSIQASGHPYELCQVLFRYYGTLDMITRKAMMAELEMKYKSQIETDFTNNNIFNGYNIVRIPYHGFVAIKARIDSFSKSISGLTTNWYDSGRFNCSIKYYKNTITGKYEIDNNATA